jgi:hypothetical protein
MERGEKEREREGEREKEYDGIEKEKPTERTQ